MKPSRMNGLSLSAVLLVLLAVAAHQARAAASPNPALDYFAGSWFCHTHGTLPDGTSFSATGDLTFHSWGAWYLATWEGGSGSNLSVAPLPWAPGSEPNQLPPSQWPPHGGHGPVINPPRSGAAPAMDNTALMLFGYDPVGANYVAFKFLPSGPFAQMTSEGPKDGVWEWSGACSNGGNNQALSVRATIDASNPNTFTSLNEASTDLGRTWMPLAAGQCFRL